MAESKQTSVTRSARLHVSTTSASKTGLIYYTYRDWCMYWYSSSKWFLSTHS